ncbi:mucosa-associated lymphoid tissue lymphoma translocation protein 1 isoform X1 [Hydra vulgaris]|uniref:mucosa-associated lymphoid tissue lymphoma translocation protein 1 isoform X1 n=1 Tax=Hydra vulgaris TaxID=6087 RepID=UPI001F5FE917|nr:mucosa-associated lymphoid tissue lymphoma translocation protein 1 isoform X1 [Hydra vulgaris]
MDSQINPNTQIRKLPYRILRDIAALLDIPGNRDWKALIAQMPDNKYTPAQISMFERQSLRMGGSPSYELLKDLGFQLMEVAELAAYLEAIDNQEALLLIKPYEHVTITMHPSSEVVQVGGSVTLHCQATGFPKPCYQWFHSNNCLKGQCHSTLKINNITMAMEGKYYCKVTNPVGSAYSNNADVHVVPMIAKIVNGITAPIYSEDCKDENHNEPLKDVASTYVDSGQYYKLSSSTHANNYQWYKNGYPIPGECKKSLIFEPFHAGDEGHYSCKTNSNGHVEFSDKENLHLGIGSLSFKNKQFATAKLALVIANQNYMSPRNKSEQLVHPINDAKLLTEKLTSIGFKVTCLVDLIKKEMEYAVDGFCKLLDCAHGMYSLFYFSGHGFEVNGKTYLVPVDASASWTTDSAMSAENILSRIQLCKKTKLDVLLLDVCRVSTNIKEDLSSFAPFVPGAQSVIGYSTCPQSQSFERRNDKNGIYMKHLSKFICENMRVENLLFEVGAAVRKETESHHLTSTMSPSVKSTTTQEFSLCDKILQGTGFVSGERDPTVEWFAFHRLPSNRVIEFDMGVFVEVRFEYVCSNTCFCVLYVQKVGQTKNCRPFLQEISDDHSCIKYDNVEDSFTINQEFISKSIRFDSVTSLSTSVNQEDRERWTLLTSIQRLNGPCFMKVRVEFEFNDERYILTQKLVYTPEEFGIISFFNAGF